MFVLRRLQPPFPFLDIYFVYDTAVYPFVFLHGSAPPSSRRTTTRRRKAKQDALRKKKDFKVVPGHHLPGGNGGAPAGTAGPPGGGLVGHVSVADAIASLEGSRGATHPGMCVCGGYRFTGVWLDEGGAVGWDLNRYCVAYLFVGLFVFALSYS